MGKSQNLSVHSDNYPLASRLADLSVSKLKSAIGANSGDYLDLASGAPLYKAPDLLKEAALCAISGDQNQYGNTFGDLELRAQIAHAYAQSCNRQLDGDSEITITAGTSSALAATLLALLNPGDEVIVFEPFYESYVQAIKLAGGIPKLVSLNTDDWSIRFDKLEKAFGKKTKAVILNSPHNPTGHITSAHDIAYILDLCEERGSILISDEIYSKLLLDNHKHVSPLSNNDIDPNRVIVIDGMSKSFNVSGWRIGFILASSYLTEAIRIVHSTLGLQAPTPLQIASRNAFSEDCIDSAVRAQNQSNLSVLHDAITEAGLKAVRPQGTNFIFADASCLMKDGNDDPRDVLLDSTGILTLSGSSFFKRPKKDGRKFLRFCFGKDTETIEEAASRLARL